eukprot:TRINITY_DN15141_c0_g2_i1.p1 TRINITY_DN15141_c0_g2~~TRINITY_DN15141_c0_g2_i1.p1  ORF type:complete len:471 (-),score=41.56 TRINITY_DN15141_c0_g2_i1:391-1803(-)
MPLLTPCTSRDLPSELTARRRTPSRRHCALSCSCLVIIVIALQSTSEAFAASRASRRRHVDQLENGSRRRHLAQRPWNLKGQLDRTVRRAARKDTVLRDEQCAIDERCAKLLPDLGVQYTSVPADPVERVNDVIKGTAVFVLPVAGPFTAYVFWREILALVHSFLGDERSLLELTQMTLNPTTNGIVVASLATALGTLTSITVWTLRQRQQDLRANVMKEATESSMFATNLNSKMNLEMDGAIAAEADPALYVQIVVLLRQYVARLATESSKRADINKLEGMNVISTELLGLTVACQQPSLPASLQADAASHIVNLGEARCARLSALGTGFPPIHWQILATVASAIAICFLIEVDQSEGRFMSERPEDSTRLRIVFTFLIFSFSALTGLCADLNDPFRGSFNINGATNQFYACLACLDQQLQSALVRLNPSLTTAEVARALKAADADDNGVIDYDEFSTWLNDNLERDGE